MNYHTRKEVQRMHSTHDPVMNSRSTAKKWDPATEQELKPLDKDPKALPFPGPVCAWRTSDLWTDGRHPSTSYEG